MNTLLVTIGAAFFLTIIAVLLLAVSLIFTGKSSIRGGTCGRDPNRKKDESCGDSFTCDLCKPEDKPKKKGS